MAKYLSDGELEAILTSQIRLAKNHDRAMRAPSRAKAIEYFLGTMKDTPSEPNRSSVISRDVADTVGWILPGIMRVYTASDRMAEAEPVTPNDVAFADQVSDGINHVFWKDNSGYQIVYNATWDALVVGNGIVKTYWDDTPQYAVAFYSGLSEDQRAQLLLPDAKGTEPEILASSERIETLPDPVTGEPLPATLYDLKLKCKKADGRFVVDCIAPEDFLIDGDAVTTDDARLTAHREEMTRSDLIAMGYSKELVLTIPRKGKLETTEDVARDRNDGGAAPDPSMDLIDYYECFVRLDIDGDGEAELIRACCAGPDGAKILDWEVWEDESPFDDIPCEPIPHRWDARSIADETMDVQRIKTVLERQALDNIYASNNPQRQIEEGQIVNMDELFTPSFGGVVVRKKGSNPVAPLEVPFVANHAFDAINYQDQVIQRRTGVSRQTMALDPEALQNQSATANQNEKDASYSQIELLARNMAELGWKKVFRKLMRLMIKHQTTPRRLLVKGKAVDIDPRYWNADMQVSINVGLGTGSRERDAGMLQAVLGLQTTLADRLSAGGFADKALEMLPLVRNTLVKFQEATGLKNPDLYWPPVGPQDILAGKQRLAQIQQQGDPKLQIAAMKAQSDIKVQQSEAQANLLRTQAETQKAQADLTIKALQFEASRQQAGLQSALDQARLQIQQLEIAARNQTQLKLAALDAATKLQTAEIAAGHTAAASVLAARLDAEAGLRGHLQDINMAAVDHAHAVDLAARTAAAGSPGGAPSDQDANASNASSKNSRPPDTGPAKPASDGGQTP